MKKIGLFLAYLSLMASLLGGCSGGGADMPSEKQGAYRLSINWQDSGNKILPGGSTTIQAVVFDGQGLQEASASLSYPQTSLTIEEIGAGPKTAEIRALDSSNNILAQRKVSFMVESGKTADSGEIPLGMAIKEDGTDVVIEPSSMNLKYGDEVLVQNWLDSDININIDKNSVVEQSLLDGFTADINGLITFSGYSANPAETWAISSNEHSTANGYVKGLITTYRHVKNIPCSDALDVALDSAGNIYVTQGGGNSVSRFNKDGNFVTSWGEYGSGDNDFFSPYGILFTNDGNLLISDRENHRLKKYDTNGTLLTIWGSLGSGSTNFDNPLSIGQDSNDFFYVADQVNKRVQKLSSGGDFLGTFGGTFSGPVGLAVDKNDRVIVGTWNTDPRMFVYSNSGALIVSGGVEGTGNGQFETLGDIETDSSGNIYAADTDNHRFQKFDSNLNFITKFGTGGTGNGKFNRLHGFCVAPDNKTVYCGDIVNNRVQVIEGY